MYLAQLGGDDPATAAGIWTLLSALVAKEARSMYRFKKDEKSRESAVNKLEGTFEELKQILTDDEEDNQERQKLLQEVFRLMAELHEWHKPGVEGFRWYIDQKLLTKIQEQLTCLELMVQRLVDKST